jgi:hypothetical protein
MEPRIQEVQGSVIGPEASYPEVSIVFLSFFWQIMV